MKLTVVGGGSTYSPELAEGLALRAKALGLDTLALSDVDPQRLDVVGGFIKRMCARIAPELRIECHRELVPAVEGARFVVIQIRVGGQVQRREDERLGRDLGVIGQETTGVGGFAKALRTVPAVLAIARVVEAHAPHATMIDFTNPVSIVTEALLQESRVPTIGLCNIPIGQRREIAAQLGVPPEDVEIDSVGLNHLSFIRGVRVRGEEALPGLIAGVSGALRSGGKPANIPDLDFPPELIESLGMIPSDYLRYFLLQRETIAEQASHPRLRAEEVMSIEEGLLAHYADERKDEKPAGLARRGGAYYSHAALEIVEAMAGSKASTGDRLIVDVANGDTLPELPRDCAIEVPCHVDASGARPLPQRPLEPAIRGLIQHVKAYEQLAVKAALSRSWKSVYLALIAHPLTPSAAVAAEMTDRIMARLR